MLETEDQLKRLYGTKQPVHTGSAADVVNDDDSEVELPAQPATEDELLKALKVGIMEGQAEATMRYIKLAIDRGYDLDRVVKEGLIGSMSSVGKDFKSGDFYVPDVLMSSRALDAALFMLEKEDAFNLADGRQSKGTIVVGTVAGDLHDIGKNIAGLLLRCNGYTVIDLGIDVVPEAFVKAVREHKPELVGISALLTTTVGEMKNIIDALVKARVRDKVRVYVSGACVTQEFADAIGADHYSPDVRDSIDYAAEVMAEAHSGQS